MWANSQSSSSTNLKPLKLLTKVPPEKLRIDVISAGAPSPRPLLTPTWQKDFKLPKVVNRERKKLSTVTTSSNGSNTSDSQSASSSSKIPPTPFSDLPMLDGQLCILDEKLDAVENRIWSRDRLFESLEKDRLSLHTDLQKELEKKQIEDQKKSTEEGKEKVKIDDQVLHPQSSQDGQGPMMAAGPQPGGWGGYLKSFW